MGENQYKQIFSRNLKYYMDLNQKEQIDLINDLGFNKSSVSTWCNGTRLPRMDKVDALAKYFGISRSDLIEEKKPDEKIVSITDYSATATPEEFENLVKPYRNLDDSGKKHINYELHRETDRMNRIAQLEYIVTKSGDSYVNAAN
jgi:transcriptional regulator with XRE-family HTH domain